MAWSTFYLSDDHKELENIFNSVDHNSYESFEDLDLDLELKNSIYKMDINLHSVLEDLEPAHERDLLDLYYIDGSYVGVVRDY